MKVFETNAIRDDNRRMPAPLATVRIGDLQVLLENIDGDPTSWDPRLTAAVQRIEWAITVQERKQ
jgi:hypothetical protein